MELYDVMRTTFTAREFSHPGNLPWRETQLCKATIHMEHTLRAGWGMLVFWTR